MLNRFARDLARSTARSAFGIVGLDITRRETLAKWRSDIARLTEEIGRLSENIAGLQAENRDLRNLVIEYQTRLERGYDYQVIMAQDQIRTGMMNLEPEFQDLYRQCREYTMTSWERLYALYKAVQYIVDRNIAGDFVECGVWRGGSMRLAAMTLLLRGCTDRTLYLYDTFEGMTEPDPELDVDAHGNRAVDDWREIKRREVKWSYAPIEEVRETIASTGYPTERVVLAKGPVETTLPGIIPDRVSLLRLDTDWYASTKQEIEHLYPRLSPEGVLIVDDYGHYRGARLAIDEYFSKNEQKPFIHRTDYSCRCAIKPAS